MYYFSLVIVALIFIWRIAAGVKKGMVKELISLIAMVAAGFCVILIMGALNSYFDQKIGQAVQFVCVLFAVCLVYRLMNVLFTSLKLISGLPVIRWLDKLLGMVLGVVEAGLITAFLVRVVKELGLTFLSV
ncbi:CvpA family protein [Suilimivivens sp.]|uniref:CvpA family protein n=1 Tax=Suilimivivens sp. TaxID=2981669 RepID=UPI003078626F